MNQFAIGFTPRAGVADLDFANAIENGRPELSQDDNGLISDDRLVQHFPYDCKFHQRASAAFAGDKAVGDAHKLKQSLLPGGHANFRVDPRVGLAPEEFRSDAVGFASGFFGAT